MAAFLENGQKCVSHIKCNSGYCKEGVCQRPEGFSPCQHRLRCPVGFQCHNINKHCLPYNFQVPAQCKVTPHCPWGRYCGGGVCKLRRSVGSSCVNHSQCIWEAACHKGTCIRKCLEKDGCLMGEECRPVPGLTGISGCMAPPRKERPMPKPGLPASGLGALKAFCIAHYKTLIGASVGILALLLLAWFISRKVKRSRAQKAASALDEATVTVSGSPGTPLEVQSIYMTQPTEPPVYSNAPAHVEAPRPAGAAAPPSYEELYGEEGDTGAGVSVEGDATGSGGERSTAHPYEKT